MADKTVDDPAALKARIEQLEREAKTKAITAWDARRQAAIDALPLPENRHRIRRDFDQDEWVCERASVDCRSYVLRDGSPVAYSGGGGTSGMWDSLTAADYDADLTFEAGVIWRQIGPHEYRESSNYGGGGGSGGARDSVRRVYTQTVGFSTYDEAESWLRRYLKPTEEIVYFDNDGKVVKP